MEDIDEASRLETLKRDRRFAKQLLGRTVHIVAGNWYGMIGTLIEVTRTQSGQKLAIKLASDKRVTLIFTEWNEIALGRPRYMAPRRVGDIFRYVREGRVVEYWADFEITKSEKILDR